MNGKTNVSEVIMNTIENGALIPLEPSALSKLKSIANNEVRLQYTDPVDKYATPGGELVAQFNRAIIVRKLDSAPASPDDGVLVNESFKQNEYSSTDLIDSDVINGSRYFYAAYSQTNYGVYSTPAISDIVVGEPTTLIYGQEVSRDTGTITHLGYHTDGTSAASINDYAVFFGGQTNSGAVTEITAFDSTLVANTTPALSTKRAHALAASTLTHIFVCGGCTKPGYTTNTILSSVECFDESLTSLGTVTSTKGCCSCGAGGSFANKIFLAGGQDRDIHDYTLWQGDQTSLDVTVYDDNMVKYDAPQLNEINTPRSADGVMWLSGAASENYMIFSGGKAMYNSSAGYVTRSDVNCDNTWCYTSDMTLVNGPSLPTGVKYNHIGVSCGNGGVIFAGGRAIIGQHGSTDSDNPDVQSSIDYISSDLTAIALDQIDDTIKAYSNNSQHKTGMQFKSNNSIIGTTDSRTMLIYDRYLTRVDDPAVDSDTYIDGYNRLNVIAQTDEYCVCLSTNGNISGNYGLRGAVWTYDLEL